MTYFSSQWISVTGEYLRQPEHDQESMHVPINDHKLTTLPYLHVLVHVKYLRNNEVTRWAVLRLLKWVDNFINIFITEKNLLVQNILKFMKVLKQWIVLVLITYEF